MTEILVAIAGAIVGAAIAGDIAYLIMIIQVNEARKLAKGQILLQFDERLDKYDKVHRILRDGLWKSGDPPIEIDWADVDGYMGLFERLHVMVQDKLVDKQIVEDLYRYRLDNIVGNREIVKEKINNKNENWERFIGLCNSLEVEIPK